MMDESCVSVDDTKWEREREYDGTDMQEQKRFWEQSHLAKAER